MEKELLHLPVIIVDDNSTNRTILSELTSNWGMDVRAADSGASALAAMREADALGERLRLAIIDSNVPGMDGFELAEQIRHDPRLAGAVIMMLSSSGQAGDAARCRQLVGFDKYASMPAAKQILRSPRMARAVMATIAMWRILVTPTSSKPRRTVSRES
jgi:CheY-like chemotaxis protein